MRCVIQVRRSFDIGGEHFVVRLYPQFRPDERRAETFTNAKSLVERLAVLGIERLDPVRSFPNLGGALDAIWTNVDVPQGVFDTFGRYGGRAFGDRGFGDHGWVAA